MKLVNILLVLAFLISLLVSCKSTFTQGKVLYDTHCANCHGDQGQGLRSLYPPINNSNYLVENFTDLACIIRYGMDTEIVVNDKNYNTAMPSNMDLGEVEITNIVNHIRESWYKDIEYLSLDDIKKTLESCK